MHNYAIKYFFTFKFQNDNVVLLAIFWGGGNGVICVEVRSVTTI